MGARSRPLERAAAPSMVADDQLSRLSSSNWLCKSLILHCPQRRGLPCHILRTTTSNSSMRTTPEPRHSTSHFSRWLVLARQRLSEPISLLIAALAGALLLLIVILVVVLSALGAEAAVFAYLL